MFVLDVTVPDLAVGIDAAGAGVVTVTGAGVSPCDLTLFLH